MTEFNADFQHHCTRFFGGWWTQRDQSLKRIRDACGISEHDRSRLARLMQGLPAPGWDQPLLEKILPLATNDMDVPPDDLFGYLNGREAVYAQQYRELGDCRNSSPAARLRQEARDEASDT